jgi:hypothetical protein
MWAMSDSAEVHDAAASGRRYVRIATLVVSALVVVLLIALFMLRAERTCCAASGPVYAAPGDPAPEYEAQIRKASFMLCNSWSLEPLAERLDTEATWDDVAVAYANGYPDDGNNRQAAINGCLRGVSERRG